MTPKEIENSDWDIPAWNDFIDRWVRDEINRHILKRKYNDGVSFNIIADEVGLTPLQTQRRFTKAHKELMKRI